MNELKDERVKSLAADIKNHLPKLCGVDHLHDKDILKLAQYIFEGYILPHENVYVDDKHEIETLKRERDEARRLFDEEKAIVERIWKMLGSPTYEQLKGRSIYDLIQEKINDFAQARLMLEDVLVELDGYIDGAPDASGKSKISNSLCAEIDSFLTRTAPAESGKKIAERPVCPCCHGTGKDWSESCNCKEPVESARPRPRR